MSIVRTVKNKYFPTLAEQLGYSDKAILVIVNIDDVGMHIDETEASFKALKFGMVKSGSVMAPCPNFDQVLNQWKEHPEIDFGIHLTLTCEWGNKYPWTPVLSQSYVPSLYNTEGIMWRNVNELLQNAKREDINMELEAQINKVIDAGLPLSHIDHHMDFYYNPVLFADVMELSRKYNLCMRVWRRRKYKLPFIDNNLNSLRRKGYVFPDTQMGIYMMGYHNQSLNLRKKKYFEYLRSLKPGVHNIKVHIALQTNELQIIMGAHDSSIRQIDYDVWCSDDTKYLAEELGILFIGFKPLQELQIKLMNK